MKPLSIGLLAAAALLAALLQLNAVREPIAGLTAEPAGDFRAEDATAAGARVWSSEGRRGADQGRITIGPIRTNETIWFQVSGHPLAPGNRVFLENRATGETYTPPLFPPDNFFRVPLRFTPPASWTGAEICLHAIDGSTQLATWVAITEPVTIPRWAGWFGGAPSRVCAFLFVGVTLSFLTLAAQSLARRCGFHDGPLGLVATLALVAVAGYAVFWSFFASPLVGAIFSGLILIGSLWLTCRPGRTMGSALSRDWTIPALLMLVVGTFDVAALHQYGGEAPMAAIAQYRFVGNVPADNQIPHDFARALESGNLTGEFAGSGWRTSDRPPLQTGWQLLLGRPAVFLRAGYNAAMQSAGVWFQLLWIPAVWAWLRSVGEQPRTVAAIIVAVAASGFFFFHSIYVWPKLGCAALVLTTFVSWCAAARDEADPRDVRAGIVLGSATAALGWLAHGGAAFALIALLPWIVANRRGFSRGRAWVLAMTAFGLLVLPWLAYQKFYDPPGNRLVKWHLAGVTGLDERGTLETLVEEYAKKDVGELTHARLENLRAVARGEWSMLARFDFSSPDARRHQEWFHTFYALGWWNAGVIVTLGTCVWRTTHARRRGRSRGDAADLARETRPRDLGCYAKPGYALAWALLTLAVWVALLFDPGTAFIHHGSFVPLLILFPLGALALWRLHPIVFVGVAVVQTATFVLVWLVRPHHWPGVPISWSAVAILIAAAIAAGAVIWRAVDSPAGDKAALHPSPLSSAKSNSRPAQR